MSKLKETKRKRGLAKTLKPPPKSRFLPGEVERDVDKMDLKGYTRHRINVVYAEPKIDDKPPRFDPMIYLKSVRLKADADRVKELDRQNEELLKKLNSISRMGGKVDCWNLYINYTKPYVAKDANNKSITKENKQLMKLIRTVTSGYSTAELLKEWELTETVMEHTAKYPLVWKDPRFLALEAKKSITGKLPSPEMITLGKSRPHCFFDVEIAETKQKLGRIVFELYSDFVPLTCANFKAFCRGHNGLSYKGTPFHRIVSGYWCQGGDVTKFNGTGGTSIYGDTFKDENFSLKHSKSGVISMWSDGENTNNSKFNITFERLQTMDGKRVVFGKVIRGLGNLYKIEELGTKVGKPIKKVIVSKCGVLRDVETTSSSTKLSNEREDAAEE